MTKLKGKVVHVRSDNAASVQVLQTGRGRCHNMMCCARQIWAIAACNDISFRVSHIMGAKNIIPDALSRRHLSGEGERKLQALMEEHGATIIEAQDSAFLLQDWKPFTKQQGRGVH